MESPNVNFTHKSLEGLLDRYSLIRDSLEGPERIRKKGKKYLPVPNVEEDPQGTSDRFKSYLQRAVYYAVTRRTHTGLVGQVFAKEPTLDQDAPEIIETLSRDIDGAGNSLYQQSKSCLSKVLAFSRAGLLVDFPKTEGGVSSGQLQRGEVSPTIKLYDPASVINWRVSGVGGKQKLSLVVLKEQKVVEDDGFETVCKPIWRVLRLTGGVYAQEIWEEVEGKELEYVMVDSSIPMQGSGKFWNEIPFTFVGSENNDPVPDEPNLYDLAELNIAHYRNSADYEESSFLVGQPTPWATGLNQHFAETYYAEGINIGSRKILLGNEGASYGLLQAEANTMPFEAMQHKERQMVALGAKLVEQRQVQRTLGEAELEEAGESSILASTARNVGNAYTKCLKWCAAFLRNVDDSKIKYELNTKFVTSTMTPQMITSLIAEYQGELITFEEYRKLRRQGGAELEEDEEAKEAIEANPPLGGIVKPNTASKEDAA